MVIGLSVTLKILDKQQMFAVFDPVGWKNFGGFMGMCSILQDITEVMVLVSTLGP